MPLLAPLALVPLLLAPIAQPVDVEAALEAPRTPSGPARVVVRFWPIGDDYRVNRAPSPRLDLDTAQRLLSLKGSVVLPSTSHQDAADDERYLEPGAEVSFPVAVAPRSAKGSHQVGAQVIYFYCSVREGTCRKGTVDVTLTVQVP